MGNLSKLGQRKEQTQPTGSNLDEQFLNQENLV